MNPYLILEELISDIEAVGLEEVAWTWPDLFVTYQHAKDVFRSKDHEVSCL